LHSYHFILFLKKIVSIIYILQDFFKQANKNFRVFKKPDFSKKSGFSENFMPENLWNLTYILRGKKKPALVPIQHQKLNIYH